MNEGANLTVGRSGVHNYTSADHTDSAQAESCGDSGTAQNFLAGAHNAAAHVPDIKSGVWGDGFCKSG